MSKEEILNQREVLVNIFKRQDTIDENGNPTTNESDESSIDTYILTGDTFNTLLHSNQNQSESRTKIQ